jgi:hypothetical protein
VSDHSASTSQSVSEVNPFFLLSDEEKLQRLNRLGDEVLLQKHYCKQFKERYVSLQSDFESKIQIIERLKSELLAIKQVNVTLLQEAKASEEKFLKLKKVTESWCLSAKRAAKCVNDQMPKQVKAIFEEDYDKAVAISEVCAMEPFYQPTPPTTVKTKSEIKFVKALGVGLGELKSESETCEETGSSSSQSVSKDSSDQKKFSKSISNQAKTKGNFSKQTKASKKKETRLSGSETKQALQKGVEKDVSVSKSELFSKNSVLDSDSVIAKLIESRLSEISKEVNFLKTISTSKCINQTKLKSEFKKAGIGKGHLKQPVSNERNEVKSGKGYLKWIAKSDNKSSLSQSESDSQASSSEPISGWVPKKN